MWKKIKELEKVLRDSMFNAQLLAQDAQLHGALKMAGGSDNGGTPLSTGDSGELNDADSFKDSNTPDGNDDKENYPENDNKKLDVEIVEILGEDPLAEDPQVGVLHPEIATRWSNFISDGLKKELKSELLAKYPRASNCQLEAQTLNPEVAASMQDAALKRDKFACEIQNVIGSAMLALGKGISMMLDEKEDGVDGMQLLQYLSDSGRLLAEAHHREAMTRRSLILPGMEKNIKEVLEKSKPDKFLIGEDLSEKIKSTKSIVKVAAEIKSKQQSKKTPVKTANQGNWKAPSSKIQGQGWGTQNRRTRQNRPGPVLRRSRINSCLSPSRRCLARRRIVAIDTKGINKGWKIEIEFDKPVLQFNEPKNFISSPQGFKDCKDAIDKLLNLGAIQPCDDVEGQFVSSYFLVDKPDGSKSRKFLRFRYQSQLYKFLCLPFGLATAPFVFTKVLKPVLNLLRKRGYVSVVYLDDILCIDPDLLSCNKNVVETIKLLESLVFIINRRESVLIPSKKCQFLGFWINSERLTLELPELKRLKILELVKTMRKKKEYKIRDLAKFIGNLIAACPAIKYGWLYTKAFERDKYLALVENENDYEGKVQLKENLTEDFAWWEKNILSSVNIFGTHQYERTIFSDASRTGWGASFFLALKVFAADLYHCKILFRMDNTTAISYVNRMGGIQYPHLSSLAKEIWQWCETRDLWIFASYIPSKENDEADRESRLSNIDTEWELADFAFKNIVHAFGKTTIDLFATMINPKCAELCSWYKDPDESYVDAFTIRWSERNFYAFPPFALIPRDSIPPTVPEDVFDCRQVIRTAFARKGLSIQTAEIMLSSLTENTIKQYSNPIKLWWQFCNKKGLDPFEISESELLDFLSTRFEVGASYGTLNSTRAAVSLIAKTSLSNSVLLNRFFKGVFKQRPLKARYDRTWDPKIVLDFLERWSPVESLKLSELTKKVTTLLALGTGLEIEIKDLIKTSKKGVKQPLLQLPMFKEKPQLCIVTHVLRYIELTKELREDCEKLLMTWRKPHKEASSQTISRWIKSVPSASGVSEEFTGYSTRHTSTSSAYRKGLDINKIKSTAGWSKSSEVFARFYNRPLQETDDNFAKTVFLGKLNM
ncbi:uncharacterized protein LOC130674191 [Microplitis mediator]|uniref:uncharacterized protein LOC130674191 n=1 Tax=Microplitis mediator TaxID=375433 RepID=UPI0025556E25|nr:uncharacterized protein LOC130674191 [Microplitis mediator]